MKKSKDVTNISSPDRWPMARMVWPSGGPPPTGTLAFWRGLSEKAARFLRDETGPTAVQYAMLTMLILTAVLAAAAGLGLATAENLDSSCELLKSTFEHRPL